MHQADCPSGGNRETYRARTKSIALEEVDRIPACLHVTIRASGVIPAPGHTI